MKERLECLRLRQSQFMLPFSYWPNPTPRQGNNIYEIRSYCLKPGTMIEWGNNWARAINYRQHNEEAFAGFFSQIGRLYNVHHIWCKYLVTPLSFYIQPHSSKFTFTLQLTKSIWSTGYKDLQARKETREAAWRKPGWDECVAYTVPLIREMDSRVLLPNKFSPSQ